MPDTATAEDLARFARVDRRMHLRPARPWQYMPTRTGNILRAAETRPAEKYGLNTVIVWPRLWLLLPGPVRDEPTAARAALDSAVAADPAQHVPWLRAGAARVIDVVREAPYAPQGHWQSLQAPACTAAPTRWAAGRGLEPGGRGVVMITCGKRANSALTAHDHGSVAEGAPASRPQ
jgi:hypothetical protein